MEVEEAELLGVGSEGGSDLGRGDMLEDRLTSVRPPSEDDVCVELRLLEVPDYVKIVGLPWWQPYGERRVRLRKKA